MTLCALSTDLRRCGRRTVLAALTLALAACGGGGGGGPGLSAPPPPSALSGKTQFVSADRSANVISGGIVTLGTVSTATATDSVQNGAARTVEQGDIYRVLDAGKTILNLNPYRGLQIIDISDATKPAIVGRAAISGTPVEMYRVGERVYVLLNNWSDYRRVNKGGVEMLDHFSGAGVITIDIANRAAPKVLASTRVGGAIQTSRLTSGDGKNALYLATYAYENIGVSDTASRVHSFAIGADGALTAKSSIELAGFTQAIAASGDRLMVARFDYGASPAGSKVVVIDTSSPNGVMVQGADAQVGGVVWQKNNMHIQGNIMRIVSSSHGISPNTTNHVESFDISDIAHPRAVDHDTFGDGQQLFGTTFLADKAFFVTYLRKDPFHAFSITADGVMHEESEFIVSGWNDFFSPVQGGTRLVGVGRNDENARSTLSVSLYDATNLKNKQPLLMRADIDLDSSWSEANWDDRAFSVLENATSVLAADGKTRETGLVLLPYSGWNKTTGQYQSGVQIFTFSASTLTRRGSMNQASRVRRSFIGHSGSALAANLSDDDLSLFDISNTNSPVAKSTLALAPSYTQLVAFTGVAVRYHQNDYGWWGANKAAVREDTLDLVNFADVDNSSAALGHLNVPTGSKIYNVAGKLVVISTNTERATRIETWDISDPSKPRAQGALVTTELRQTGYNVGNSPGVVTTTGVLVNCGFTGCNYGAPEPKVIGRAMVFPLQDTQMTAPTKDTAGRYWTNYSFFVVDLSDATKPMLLPKINMAQDEEAVGLVQSGNTLWVNYKKAQAAAVDGQPLAKFFVKALDLSNPALPALGVQINIPGQLMAVSGSDIYTRDEVWNGKKTEQSVNMLIVQDNLAFLQASTSLNDQDIHSVIPDGKSVLVNHASNAPYGHATVSIFNIANKTFELQAAVNVDPWSTLLQVRQGKMLVRAQSGYLLYDISKPKAAFAQAWFPAFSFGNALSTQESDIYLAAGPFGVYHFSFNTVNLGAP